MPRAALAEPAACPSPAPPCVEHDHSAGVRARVTIHAIRRYGDRILGLEEVLEGLDDLDAVDAMIGMDVPVLAIRDWIAFYGGVGKRHGAAGVCRDGIGLVLQGGAVVTVISLREHMRKRDTKAGWIYGRGSAKEVAYGPRLLRHELVHKLISIPRSDGTIEAKNQVRVTPRGLFLLRAELAQAERDRRKAAGEFDL